MTRIVRTILVVFSVATLPHGMGHASGGARKRWGNSGDTVPRR